MLNLRDCCLNDHTRTHLLTRYLLPLPLLYPLRLPMAFIPFSRPTPRHHLHPRQNLPRLMLTSVSLILPEIPGISRLVAWRPWPPNVSFPRVSNGAPAKSCRIHPRRDAALRSPWSSWHVLSWCWSVEALFYS